MIQKFLKNWSSKNYFITVCLIFIATAAIFFGLLYKNSKSEKSGEAQNIAFEAGKENNAKNNEGDIKGVQASGSPVPSAAPSESLTPAASVSPSPELNTNHASQGDSKKNQENFNFIMDINNPEGLKLTFPREEGLKHDDFEKLEITIPKEFVFSKGEHVFDVEVVGRGEVIFEDGNQLQQRVPIVIVNDHNLLGHYAHFKMVIGDIAKPEKIIDLFVDVSEETKLSLVKEFVSPVRSPEVVFTLYEKGEGIGGEGSRVFLRPNEKKDYKFKVFFDFFSEAPSLFDKVISVF